MAPVELNDEFRSPLARDARALIARVVDVMADARARRQRGVVSRPRELYDSITALASWERAQGAPPEHVVVLLKGLVIDAERDRLDVSEARLLMDDVVRWGIEAYYAADRTDRRLH